MASQIDQLRQLLEMLGALDVDTVGSPQSTNLGTSHHEAGHTVTAWFSPFIVRVERVSIVAENRSSGVLMAASTNSRTAAGMYDGLVISLAGLAGALMHHPTVYAPVFGADLVEARAYATILAYEIPTAFRLKRLVDGKGPRLDVAKMYRAAPTLRERAFLNDALEEARCRIDQYKDPFARLVLELQRRKTLLEADLVDILGPRPWAPR